MRTRRPTKSVNTQEISGKAQSLEAVEVSGQGADSQFDVDATSPEGVLAKYKGMEDLCIPSLEEVEVLWGAIAPTDRIKTRGYAGPMVGLAVNLPAGRVAFRDRGEAWDSYLAKYGEKRKPSWPKFPAR